MRDVPRHVIVGTVCGLCVLLMSVAWLVLRPMVEPPSILPLNHPSKSQATQDVEKLRGIIRAGSRSSTDGLHVPFSNIEEVYPGSISVPRSQQTPCSMAGLDTQQIEGTIFEALGKERVPERTGSWQPFVLYSSFCQVVEESKLPAACARVSKGSFVYKYFPDLDICYALSGSDDAELLSPTSDHSPGTRAVLRFWGGERTRDEVCREVLVELHCSPDSVTPSTAVVRLQGHLTYLALRWDHLCQLPAPPP